MMITAEVIVEYKQSKMIHVNENTSIYDALRIMVDKKIGALIVKHDETIVGLWTERDLMINCLSDDFDLKHSKIGDFISREINSVPHDTPLPKLQERFLGLFIRHVFVKKEDVIIGLISCGDAMEAGLHYISKEMENLNTFVSIDYYENWSKPQKR